MQSLLAQNKYLHYICLRKNKIMSANKEYEFLKANGVLLELFPELSGEWVDDKKVFTQMWDLNNNALKDLDVIIDDEE